MKDKRLALLLYPTLALGVLGAIGRSLLTVFSLDTRYGVYAHGSVMPTVFHILLFVGIAAMIGIGFSAARDHRAPAAPTVGSFTLFTACISAFMIAANTLLSLYYIMISGAAPALLELLGLCFSVPAVIFFLSFAKSMKKPLAVAFCSFFPIAWLAVNMVTIYFDTSTLNTSPGKTMSELAMLAAMVYLLCESRFLLGNSSGRLFLTAAPAAVILLFTSSVPNLFLSDKLLIGENDSFLVNAVELAIGLFILSRLHSFADAQTAPSDGEIRATTAE